MSRKLIFSTILVFICFVSYVVYWNSYGYYQRPYEPGHAIIYATIELEHHATQQLHNNLGTLHNLEKDQSFYYMVNSDSVRIYQLYNEGMQLHNLTNFIFTNLLIDTTLKSENFGINMEYQKRLDGKAYSSHNIYRSKNSFSKAHAALTQKKINKFLSLTSKFKKSAATEQRYNHLLTLARLSAPKFYNQLFGRKYYYLFSGKFAVIRSQLVAIETEYLYNLKQNIYSIEKTRRENNAWIALVVNPNSKAESSQLFNSPVSVNANDTLNLLVKLKEVIKSNLALKTLPLSGGTIDSIHHNAVGYFSFPIQPNFYLPNKSGSKAIEKNHSISYTLSLFNRDSAFTTQFRYFTKKGK